MNNRVVSAQKLHRRAVSLLCGCALLSLACTHPEEPLPELDTTPWKEIGYEGKTYICNGVIQIGVDLDRGGAIFHLSTAEDHKNLLDHYDDGRFVQQSFYGDTDGSMWGSNPWRYNPVQGGGYRAGHSSKVESSEITPTCIKCTTTPTHWATCQPLPECVMKEEITLDGNVAHIRFTFNYNGTKSHASRPQELPAVFCNASLKNLYYYSGVTPWAGKPLSKVVPADRKITDANEYLKGNNWTEKWAAYTDDNGYGLGIYSPQSSSATYYRFGTGAAKDDCSYIAPLASFSLLPGLTKTYEVYLTIGTLEQIRERFKIINNQ